MNFMDMLPLIMGMSGKDNTGAGNMGNMGNMGNIFKNFGAFKNQANQDAAPPGGASNQMGDMANILQLMNMMNKNNQAPKKQTPIANFFRPINGLSSKRIDCALLELMQLRYSAG